mmetsp:Transcript_9097/g.16797  ORF Transcript_9097/g.16797 Transcript_9097/m.16797 type:complete len:144 (+) Transcript_9097:3-434(+)
MSIVNATEPRGDQVRPSTECSTAKSLTRAPLSALTPATQATAKAQRNHPETILLTPTLPAAPLHHHYSTTTTPRQLSPPGATQPKLQVHLSPPRPRKFPSSTSSTRSTRSTSSTSSKVHVDAGVGSAGREKRGGQAWRSIQQT